VSRQAAPDRLRPINLAVSPAARDDFVRQPYTAIKSTRVPSIMLTYLRVSVISLYF
jgi:hypothetical protein